MPKESKEVIMCLLGGHEKLERKGGREAQEADEHREEALQDRKDWSLIRE